MAHPLASLDGLEAPDPTGRSLMPEGLEAGLSPVEMANLLAFISNPN